jgi:hypothetical protein
VWIYAQGAAAGGWLGQGIRFGVAVAFMAVVPTYMIYYVVQPMPGSLVVKQVVFDGVLVIILGVIAAWFHRHPAART